MAKTDLGEVADLGCILCWIVHGVRSPATVHHMRTGAGMGRRGERVIPLCPEHHQGDTGVHGLGRREFERVYGLTESELADLTEVLLALRRTDPTVAERCLWRLAGLHATSPSLLLERTLDTATSL